MCVYVSVLIDTRKLHSLVCVHWSILSYPKCNSVRFWPTVFMIVNLLFPFVLLPDMFIWWNKDFQRSSASPRLEAVGWRCKSVCLWAGAMYAEVQKRQQNHSRGGLAPAAGGRGGGRGKGPPQRAPPPPPNGQSTNLQSAQPGYVGITIVNNIYCTSGS